MDEITRQTAAEDEYRDHLERSATVWDRWSDWYTLSEQDFEPLRLELIDALEIQEGDRILEIGCGPGVNFAPLRNAVGPEGQVIAIDYSAEMVAKARARIDDHDWENVNVVRADATTAALGGPYDGAIATLSLSVMPDIPRTVGNIYDSLSAGSPLGVIDLRLVPDGPARVFNPAIARFLRWYANWHGDDDVLKAIDSVFGSSTILTTELLGIVYAATAIRD